MFVSIPSLNFKKPENNDYLINLFILDVCLELHIQPFNNMFIYILCYIVSYFPKNHYNTTILIQGFQG